LELPISENENVVRDNHKYRVLVGCEYSGTVRDAFADMGWDAWSCDLLPSEQPGNHYQCGVKAVLDKGWDLFIGHPTCTYLTNSGVCWLHKDPSRWYKMRDAAVFFNTLLRTDIEYVAIENPIPHKYARELLDSSYTQLVQPWMFGHMESKATCLWLRNLPNLQPTNIVKDRMMLLPYKERNRLHYLPPGPDRWKERSRTYPGIAQAMAAQWTDHIENIP